MKNSPTPETDAFVKDKQCPGRYSQDWADEITDFARKLELDRDRLRKVADQLAQEYEDRDAPQYSPALDAYNSYVKQRT